MINNIMKLFSNNKFKKDFKEDNKMKKVLYITANPKSEIDSFSLKAGRTFINKYISENPEDKIIELDLYELDIPFIDEDVFSAWGKLANGEDFNSLTESEQLKVGGISKYTEQFIEADKYIFVTPMWNLSLPPKVKMYIDTLMIAGKTFQYTENGPEGLLNDKKAFHIHASGGVYSSTEMSHMEFADSYLKTVLGFMGVKDYRSVLLEGTAFASDNGIGIHNNAKEAMDRALESFK